MTFVQCTFCRKPFTSLGGRICPACNEQIDRDFITVREYIYENKHSNIDKIAKETEVPKQHIIHLLKEGRLIIDSVDGDGILFCEVCKKPINTGRMCKECMSKVASTIDKKTSSSSSSRPKQEHKDEPNIKGSAKIGSK
ncbi:MAG: hypothetical protein LBC73_09805 [Oscillospiraceae bacterium]|jgi:predicted amidophosphoribosyltransferase|nr:hypothetical protein [Oscillospiraceae bacterium]